MTAALSHVNWLAVLGVTLAHFVLGGVWYMGLFPKQYRASLGLGDEPAQKPGASCARTSGSSAPIG